MGISGRTSSFLYSSLLYPLCQLAGNPYTLNLCPLLEKLIQSSTVVIVAAKTGDKFGGRKTVALPPLLFQTVSCRQCAHLRTYFQLQTVEISCKKTAPAKNAPPRPAPQAFP